MGRSKLLAFLFLSLALASPPAFAKSDSTKSTAESEGAMQTNAQEGIKKAQESLNGINGETPSTAQEIKRAGDSCKQALEDGKGACLEKSSPFVKQMSGLLPAAMTAMAAAAGTAQQCQLMQQLGQSLAGLQGQYNDDCQAKKTACTDKCSAGSQKAADALSTGCDLEAKSKHPDYMIEPDKTLYTKASESCKMAVEENRKAISSGVDACTDLQANADAGKENSGQLAQGLANSFQCKQDVVDCTKDPKNAQCPKVIDCNDPEDAKNEPKCICALSPNSAGCSGSNSSKITNRDTTSPVRSSDDSTGTDGTSASGSPTSSSDTPSGGSLPASPGGADGGSLKGAGPDGKQAPAAKDKKNDSSGGEYSGGGGGHSGSSDPYGKYAALLPKDKKKLQDAKAADQVTGSAGMTNWQKVKACYDWNRSTFLDVEKFVKGK